MNARREKWSYPQMDYGHAQIAGERLEALRRLVPYSNPSPSSLQHWEVLWVVASSQAWVRTHCAAYTASMPAEKVPLQRHRLEVAEGQAHYWIDSEYAYQKAG